MKRLILAFALGAPSFGVWSLEAYPDFGYAPPADWTGPMFVLSQSYPSERPAVEVLPWTSIDPAKEPEEYLWALLDYSFQGNVERDFDVKENTVRPWFHAPWMHWGNNAREFVRGLTRERSSRPYELAPTQTDSHRNYAVGLYNAPGGFTIGQVWKNPAAPNVMAATFPEGTVTFKLLFTTAPVSQAPFLEGAPEWVADLDRSPTAAEVRQRVVRLLQIDVAVKDARSRKGGWIFGTFHYDKDVVASSAWRRVRPLALMWGDDPTLTHTGYQGGARPTESWINPASPIVAYRSNPPNGASPPPTLGWAGRANGPVDNALSSCLSCHGTAQIPAKVGMVPAGTVPEPGRLAWYRNLAAGEAFSAGSASLDYSLQLGVGIQNHADFMKFVTEQGGIRSNRLKVRSLLDEEPEFRFTRDID